MRMTAKPHVRIIRQSPESAHGVCYYNSGDRKIVDAEVTDTLKMASQQVAQLLNTFSSHRSQNDVSRLRLLDALEVVVRLAQGVEGNRLLISALLNPGLHLDGGILHTLLLRHLALRLDHVADCIVDEVKVFDRVDTMSRHATLSKLVLAPLLALLLPIKLRVASLCVSQERCDRLLRENLERAEETVFHVPAVHNVDTAGGHFLRSQPGAQPSREKDCIDIALDSPLVLRVGPLG